MAAERRYAFSTFKNLAVNELLAVIPTIITSIVTSIVTWLFARKRNNAETDTVELDNVQKAVAIWRESATDLKEECTKLREEIAKLREENYNLKITLNDLQSQMHEIQLKNN